MVEKQKSPILNNSEAFIFENAKRLLLDSQEIRAKAKNLHREARIYREHAQRLRQMGRSDGRNSAEKVVFGSFCQ